MNSHEKERLAQALQRHRSGAVEQAARLYQELVHENPSLAEAWHLLGLTYFQQGSAQDATECLSRAINLDASQATYFNAHGIALQAAGKRAEALAAFNAALRIKADFLESHLNLIEGLTQAGQRALALQQVVASLALFPCNQVLLLRGAKLAEFAGKTNLAIEWLQRWLSTPAADSLSSQAAAQKEAEVATVLTDLGRLMLSAGRPADAVGHLRRAIEIRSSAAEAHLLLSHALQAIDEVQPASDSLRRAIHLRPDKFAWRLRHSVLCPVVFESGDAVQKYSQELHETLRQLLAAGQRLTREDLFEGQFIPPYLLAFQGRDVRLLKEEFAELCRSSFEPVEASGTRGKRIRVGFVVTSGHERLFARCMGGIVERLDRSRFEPFLFCSHDCLRMLRVEMVLDGVHVVSLDSVFQHSVNRIAESRCDILYYWEVGSDVLNYFLPFMRLAPLQCTSWGTQLTSGLREVDIYLSSVLVETDHGDSFCTEKLWRLASLPTFQRRIACPNHVSKAFFGLGENTHVYLCPQTLWKIHPDQDQLFGQILRKDERGVVVLKERQWPAAGRQIRSRLERTIPDVVDRIVMLPWQSQEDYYRLLQVADVVLDPAHYSAGSSAYDMFSFGVPVVALPGVTNLSRYTLGCYRQMGIGDLVADNEAKYVEIACRLGTEPVHAADMRRRIVRESAALFDDASSVAAHEACFGDILSLPVISR